MEIWVTFEEGKFRLSEDPARVERGTPVSWRVNAPYQLQPVLRWEVYFDRGSPFGSAKALITTTTILAGRQHIGITSAAPANVPGDYKYGIRLVDADSLKILGDDDPRLVVTP